MITSNNNTICVLREDMECEMREIIKKYTHTIDDEFLCELVVCAQGYANACSYAEKETENDNVDFFDELSSIFRPRSI